MRNKKVALVTCYFIRNYGSQLQALATQMVVQKLGYECEHICVDGLLPEINKSRKRFFIRNICNFEVWNDKIPFLKRVLYLKTIGRKYRKLLGIRTKMFSKFSADNFIVSRRFNSKKELTAAAYDYDSFVVGSDQLWLPSNIAGDYYTLNFVPEDINKISLATSFGVASLPQEETIMAEAFLKRINHISVREQCGKNLVKRISGRDVPVVCDPTIMITAEMWDKIIPQKRIEKEKYIFCYLLGDNAEQRELIKFVSEKIKLKIVQIHSSNSFLFACGQFADYEMFEAGPLEFLQMIRDAEYVFTDSFHCTVFSLLFEKRFYTFRRFTKEGKFSTNGRIYSLLDVVSLQDRMLNGNESIDEILSMTIDYQSVSKSITTFRKYTWDWFSDALRS